LRVRSNKLPCPNLIPMCLLGGCAALRPLVGSGGYFADFPDPRAGAEAMK